MGLFSKLNKQNGKIIEGIFLWIESGKEISYLFLHSYNLFFFNFFFFFKVPLFSPHSCFMYSPGIKTSCTCFVLVDMNWCHNFLFCIWLPTYWRCFYLIIRQLNIKANGKHDGNLNYQICIEEASARKPEGICRGQLECAGKRMKHLLNYSSSGFPVCIYPFLFAA